MASILIFLSMRARLTAGGWKGVGEKTEGVIDLVHNKSLGFWLTIGLSFIRYKNKTTFVCCAVCEDHFVCGRDLLTQLWWFYFIRGQVCSSVNRAQPFLRDQLCPIVQRIAVIKMVLPL